jgi:hypothetical protein
LHSPALDRAPFDRAKQQQPHEQSYDDDCQQAREDNRCSML